LEELQGLGAQKFVLLNKQQIRIPSLIDKTLIYQLNWRQEVIRMQEDRITRTTCTQAPLGEM
jgi:hypothetical protein